MLVENGHVAALGEARELLAKLPEGCELTEYPGQLIIPGMIDIHVHYPQTDIIASYGTPLLDWLETDLPAFFSGRLLPIDSRVAVRWGQLQAAAGRTLPAMDSRLAATALEHGLTLVTRNIRDFSGLPVQVFDPWKA